jgi:hypothetical protein
MAATAKWEADRCSKHYGYRLKGKAGSKRPGPMTSVKSLVLQTEERACPDWSVPKAVWTPRGRQLMVVQRRSITDAGASLPPLQPMERPADDAAEDVGKGHRLESEQMPTCADF